LNCREESISPERNPPFLFFSPGAGDGPPLSFFCKLRDPVVLSPAHAGLPPSLPLKRRSSRVTVSLFPPSEVRAGSLFASTRAVRNGRKGEYIYFSTFFSLSPFSFVSCAWGALSLPFFFLRGEPGSCLRFRVIICTAVLFFTPFLFFASVRRLFSLFFFAIRAGGPFSFFEDARHRQRCLCDFFFFLPLLPLTSRVFFFFPSSRCGRSAFFSLRYNSGWGYTMEK